jgi:hypothetical protein
LTTALGLFNDYPQGSEAPYSWFLSVAQRRFDLRREALLQSMEGNLEGGLGKVLVATPTVEYAFNAAQRFMALHNQAEHWRIKHECGLLYVHRIEHFYDQGNAQQ